MGLSSKVSSFDEMLKRIVKESIEGALSQPGHSEEDKQTDLARRLQSVGKSHSREVLMDEEEDETPSKKDKNPEGEKEDSKHSYAKILREEVVKVNNILQHISTRPLPQMGGIGNQVSTGFMNHESGFGQS